MENFVTVNENKELLYPTVSQLLEANDFERRTCPRLTIDVGSEWSDVDLKLIDELGEVVYFASSRDAESHGYTGAIDTQASIYFYCSEISFWDANKPILFVQGAFSCIAEQAKAMASSATYPSINGIFIEPSESYKSQFADSDNNAIILKIDATGVEETTDSNPIWRPISCEWRKAGQTLPFEIIEAIQSTGTQYIDTGVAVTQSFKMQTTYAQTHRYALKYEGIYDLGEAVYVCTGINSSVNFAGAFGQSLKGTNVDWDTDYHTYILANGSFEFDGNSFSIIPIANDLTETFKMFKSTNTLGSDTSTQRKKQKLCMIWNDSGMQRMYIPVRYNNQIGMWDFVNWEFVGNDGTGEFEAVEITE